VKAIYGLYAEGAAAQRAVDALRAAGLSDGDITVITSAPMEDFPFSHIGSKNRLWYAACAGGAVGLASSVALVRYTSTSWPMNVGNMATVAWWPFLVPIFELTMLGAIVATVGTLFVSNGLLRRRPVLYDPEVTNGKILVGVENPGEGRRQDVERALKVGPDVALKTL
jgi:hypothetical protein